jgi:LPS O-antigen subunit length determinant protein (WzzB/FepE family)
MPSPTDLQILTRLHSLELKTRGLLEALRLANRRIDELERERDGLNVQLRTLQQELKDAQKKEAPALPHFYKSDKNRKLAVENYFYTADNPAELKDRLDQYIREIDQCIAYLSSSNTL